MCGLAVFLLLPCAPASAAEVAGVQVAERAQIGLDGPKLVLNGAGLRTRFVFKVYVAALYLPVKVTSGEEILRADLPRRLVLHILRALTAKELTDSMNEALAETLSPAERAPIDSRVQQFHSVIEAVRHLRPGMQIAIDYVPKLGTNVVINGVVEGNIAGVDFNQALLRVWIGNHPRDVELRTALLGTGP